MSSNVGYYLVDGSRRLGMRFKKIDLLLVVCFFGGFFALKSNKKGGLIIIYLTTFMLINVILHLVLTGL